MQVEDAVEEPVSKIQVSPAFAARGTETILLVEDQDGIRDLVREFIQKATRDLDYG